MSVDRSGPSASRSHRLATAIQGRPWLAYLALTVLAYPITEMVVAGERATQYAHDVFDDDIPRLFSIAADWRTYGPSLWDPHLTGGNALVAQFALPPTAPDVVLSFVVPPFMAYFLNAALMAFLAGLAMHLFLRDSLRLRPLACFAGGILATLAFWHYIYGFAALLLPAVLWSTDRALAAGRTRSREWVVASAIVLFLFLSSQVQIVLLDGAIALAWVLATRDRGRAPVLVARLASIWAAAFLLATPVLLTQIAALPASQRTVWRLADVPLGTAIVEAAHRYARVVFGVAVRRGLGGSADIYGSYFAGVVGVAALSLSVLAPRADRRLRFVLVLLALIPLIDIVATVVAGHQAGLPIVGSFQFVRIRHLMPVAVIANVAVGLSWLLGDARLEGVSDRRRRLALGAVAVAFTPLAVQAYVAVREVRHPPANPTLAAGWDLAAVALVGGLLAAAAIVLDIARRWRRRAVPTALPATVGVAIVVVLAAGQAVFSRGERDLDGQLGSWAANVAETPAQAFIAAQPGPGRVLSLGDHANRSLVPALDAVDGYETIYPLRYHELFGVLTAPYLSTNPARYVYFHRWGNRAYAFGPGIDWPIADLLGIRWVHATGTTLSDPALVQRYANGNETVYENPDVLPRAFVAHRLTVVADRPALLAALAAASKHDLRSTAFVEAASAPAGVAGGGIGQPSDDTAAIDRDTPDQVDIHATVASDGLLVLADTYDPSWTVTVDGRPSTVVPVDDALRGVVLAAGSHLVSFRYRPTATYVGLGLAAATVVVLVASFLLGRRRWRRLD